MSVTSPINSEVDGSEEVRRAPRSTEGVESRTNGRHYEPFDSKILKSDLPDQSQARDHERADTKATSTWRWRCELALGAIGIAITLVAFAAAAYDISREALTQFSANDFGKALGNLIFGVFIGLIVYGGLVYQATRLAYAQRRRRHLTLTAAEFDGSPGRSAPDLTILIPSYKEEIDLVRMVLLSAALQNYAHRRIVLLIDDPSNPDRQEDLAALESMRRLPQELQSEYSNQHARYLLAQQSFQQRATAPTGDEASLLAGLLDAAADWLGVQAQLTRGEEHVRQVLVEKVLHARAVPLREAASRLRDPTFAPSMAELEQHYDHLVRLFDAELTSFERKRYENLSHEPNKAMNLNSYIGLLGKSFREERRDGKLFFIPASDDRVDLQVPAADYLLTLDADSLILPDYAATLMSLCEAPGNERIAVAQTPYSAFPSAPRQLERAAGATTDIQYVIHQGFTAFQGTYWVGANALLRTEALVNIEERITERGYPVSRFIQDSTVIEDTESSVDLISRGWRLFNYPERMSYSATPPDFGSLIIQRRRWSNGGLIILPKLLRYFARGPKTLGKLFEVFVRTHYLISIAAVNIGLAMLLLIPLVNHAPWVWLPLTALPYFIAYARDLSVIGYKASDVFRVYALNLLLIPVNLAGVGMSLQQAVTGRKTPFVRTPKVAGRTRAEPVYILAVWGFALYLMCIGSLDLLTGRFVHGAFALGNGAFLWYAIVAFVGWRESRDDLSHAFELWKR